MLGWVHQACLLPLFPPSVPRPFLSSLRRSVFPAKSARGTVLRLPYIASPPSRVLSARSIFSFFPSAQSPSTPPPPPNSKHPNSISSIPHPFVSSDIGLLHLHWATLRRHLPTGPVRRSPVMERSGRMAWAGLGWAGLCHHSPAQQTACVLAN
ncbi:hypothetical protein BO70DRAFT_36119 [Aspergillus heteromorphus CBS 117.55]|uniref:Uncharacterized protein n=1 Tax=Aspergillus heteromorphus CBS 117.55 TaxID=1448321 RepID=A0A317W6D5_9EURO|nr:uncharacterized protein BO70DRAFT_36119 [Aspergillus heteromorphus CBS 117.55]PWY82176.1 hypothetical protein BO70DRAFT_36119 [Aspergillus heteromorphus CBS 117.55]